MAALHPYLPRYACAHLSRTDKMSDETFGCFTRLESIEADPDVAGIGVRTIHHPRHHRSVMPNLR